VQLDDERTGHPSHKRPLTFVSHIDPHLVDVGSILDVSLSQAIDDEHDPPTVRLAQRSKYWNEVLPTGRKPVQCKWVLQVSCTSNGTRTGLLISRFNLRARSAAPVSKPALPKLHLNLAKPAFSNFETGPCNLAGPGFETGAAERAPKGVASSQKDLTQIFGRDFTFTFAPVARSWESIRAILCISCRTE
jgi:hypothetical protein